MSNTAMLNLIGNFKYIGVSNLSATGHPGDICTYDGCQYVYYDTEWIPLNSNIQSDYKTQPKICSQCGAPLFSNTCEYCGTRYW